jgi:hypothetical protein
MTTLKNRTWGEKLADDKDLPQALVALKPS